MKNFISVKDVDDLELLLTEALILKADPYKYMELGRNKTLGLIFMNPSFRTRLSTQRAAQNIGLHCIVLNITQEGWQLEMLDGAIMNTTSVEHIKDAASIMGLYCDIIGVRSFANLNSKEEDYSESVLNQFIKHCHKPVISLESATLHPLQSLADLITIQEHWIQNRKPKVVLCWAPHVKPLPQAVANSFSEWMCRSSFVDFAITHPEGYALDTSFTKGAIINTNQREALRDADFVYLKNWSSFNDYGNMPEVDGDWLIKENFLHENKTIKIMHCMPVRRNVEVSDCLLDSSQSLILKQAENRIYAAQIVLKKMLEN